MASTAYNFAKAQQINIIGREPDLALVLTKTKKFSLRFLFSLTTGT